MTVVAITNKTILIDKYGKPGQTRLIDPLTGDYVFNNDGRIVGGNGIQQMVYLAMKTIRGSCAETDLGQTLSNIKVIGNNYATLVKNEVNKALKPLVDQKKIEIIDIQVSRAGSNKSIINVKWRDLETLAEMPYLKTATDILTSLIGKTTADMAKNFATSIVEYTKAATGINTAATKLSVAADKLGGKPKVPPTTKPAGRE
jgi:phage gp46-like protein